MRASTSTTSPSSSRRTASSTSTSSSGPSGSASSIPTQLKIANAAEVERELLGEEKDGAWHSARWRVKGTLRGEFPVHRFPFDRQTLSVVLELPERDGELVPDLAGSGMRERFSVTGWLYEPSFAPRVGQETYRSDLGSHRRARDGRRRCAARRSRSRCGARC